MNARVGGIVLFTLLMTLAGARAEEGLGLGIMVGEPTGLSVKKWLSQEQAIDAGAAWSFSESESVQFHADYLLHRFGVLTTAAAAGRLPVYFGVGGRVKLKGGHDGRGRNDDDALIGVRVPLGISYLVATAPVDLFAEIVPILDVVPATDFDVNGAIGVRLYFR